MTWDKFFEIFQNFGSFIGVLLTLGSFWILISRRPKEKFRSAIREECKAANNELENDMKEMRKNSEENRENVKAILRHDITEVYFKYKDVQKMPSNVKNDVLSLFERYEKIGGNSFVHSLIDEMKNWEIE